MAGPVVVVHKVVHSFAVVRKAGPVAEHKAVRRAVLEVVYRADSEVAHMAAHRAAQKAAPEAVRKAVRKAVKLAAPVVARFSSRNWGKKRRHPKVASDNSHIAWFFRELENHS